MQKKWFGVHKSIFLLGLVSFLTDISSEMIFSVFSLFFTVILGASAFLLGLVEGLADFSASSLDYLSGFISDRLGKKKVFAFLGYSFSTLAKVLLLISSSLVSAFTFRVVERLGKSFRGPPRDAWIASLSDKECHGYSFGFHKTLDKAGAIFGPFIAYGFLAMWGQTKSTFQWLFLAALVPAILAVFLLLLIKEKPAQPAQKENIFKAYKSLSPHYKHYLLTAGIFSLAYFSFGFLLLKAYQVGFALKDVVLLYALFNLAFVLVAAPLGKLGDLVGRRKILVLEFVVYLLMSLGFIFASNKVQVVLMFALFGIFYAIDESQSKAYIADLEAKKRGTAIGLYNFVTGLIYLPASLVAGYLWMIKPAYTFTFAAVISILALIFFVFKRK